MRAGRTALGAIALAAAMAATSAPLAAQERLPPQASTSEGSSSKPADADLSKPKSEDGVRKSRLVSILGREVTNRAGDSGRVIDVLVDLNGRSGAVVVEFGGFMGIGSRKIAVEWEALRFVREGNRTMLIVDVSREQIRDTPEYKANEPTTVLSTTTK